MAGRLPGKWSWPSWNLKRGPKYTQGTGRGQTCHRGQGRRKGLLCGLRKQRKVSRDSSRQSLRDVLGKGSLLSKLVRQSVVLQITCSRVERIGSSEKVGVTIWRRLQWLEPGKREEGNRQYE